MFYSSTWILINADNCANIFSMVTIGFYILVGMMGGCFSARICFIDREIIMKMELGFNKFCCWLLRWTNKFTVVVFSLLFIKCVNIGVNNFGWWFLKWRCRLTFFNVVFGGFFFFCWVSSRVLIGSVALRLKGSRLLLDFLFIYFIHYVP